MTLPTCSARQVGSYPGHSGCDANAFRRPASDPNRTTNCKAPGPWLDLHQGIVIRAVASVATGAKNMLARFLQLLLVATVLAGWGQALAQDSIYAENDTYFGPPLTKRMHDAFTDAGGNAQYHVLPPFGNDGHFPIDSAAAVQLWAPLVSTFLEEHP